MYLHNLKNVKKVFQFKMSYAIMTILIPKLRRNHHGDIDKKGACGCAEKNDGHQAHRPHYRQRPCRDLRVSRQTFYYHFDDVYDLLEWVFEEDANANLPSEVVYDNWKHDVTLWFKYLYDNSTFALNVYNSNSRLYMLRYIKGRLRECIRSFSEIVAENRSIDRQDFEFIVEFYSNIVVGLISQWMDQGMQLPKEITTDKVLRVLDNSIENIMARFEKK